jgi:hypothetical protein
MANRIRLSSRDQAWYNQKGRDPMSITNTTTGRSNLRDDLGPADRDGQNSVGIGSLLLTYPGGSRKTITSGMLAVDAAQAADWLRQYVTATVRERCRRVLADGQFKYNFRVDSDGVIHNLKDYDDSDP